MADGQRCNDVPGSRDGSRPPGSQPTSELSRNVYWSLTAWQNLMYFGRLKGLLAAEVRPPAERLLTGLGL